MGAFNVFRTFLPYMRKITTENNSLWIYCYRKPVFGSSAITSKDALKGLSKSVNIENKNNIKSTIINLGYSELGMIKKVPEKIKKDIIKNLNIIDYAQKVRLFKWLMIY